jgi:hypothetical protein
MPPVITPSAMSFSAVVASRELRSSPDELRGAKRPADGACGRVGVHVQRASLVVNADRRNHWNEAALGELLDDACLDVHDFAHAPEIDQHRLTVLALGLDAVELLRDEEAIVFARQADGAPPVLTDKADDFLIHAAAKHHLDELHRVVVRDA